MSMPSAISSAPPAQAAPASGSDASGSGHEFSFHDLLETINPLQHLPIISTIYRHLTGDTISNSARIAGDTLYGGPVGLVMGMINANMVNKNGKDMGDRVVAMVDGGDSNGDAGTDQAAAGPQVAANSAGAADDMGMPSKPISSSVTLSALPSKPPPNLVPDYRAAIAKAQPLPGMSQGMPVSPQASSIPTLPAMDSGETASELATAAPITTQTAQLQGLMPTAPTPPGAGGRPVAMQGQGIAMPMQHGFAIDTSPEGIYAMQAHTHTKAPVPLELSSGAARVPQKLPVSAQPAPISSDVFAERMREGLAKYKTMMQQQGGDAVTAQAVTPAQTVH
jgi:hypothetical protein